ncbi:MAG: hypothetical protein QXR63_01245 [Candidatus Bathyarchaeia archaeon]
MSISRNTIAYALINFAFWGFLGAQAYSSIYHGFQATLARGVPISALSDPMVRNNILLAIGKYVGDFAYFEGVMGSIFSQGIFFLLGFGIAKIFTKRNVMIAIAGFGSAILNILLVVADLDPVINYIVQCSATILLYMGLNQWMFSNVEYKSNPYQSLALSGWGGILIVAVMGSLFQANTAYAGLTSYQWAFVFAYSVLTMFGIGGLLLKKEAEPTKH